MGRDGESERRLHFEDFSGRRVRERNGSERERQDGERDLIERLKYSWVFGSRGERALISPLRV